MHQYTPLFKRSGIVVSLMFALLFGCQSPLVQGNPDESDTLMDDSLSYTVIDLSEKDWQFEGWQSYPGEVHHKTEVVDGERNWILNSKGLNDLRWMYSAAVTPGHYYVFEAEVKTAKVGHTEESVDAGANICLTDGYHYSGELFGSNSWTQMRLFFTGEESGLAPLGMRLGYWSGTTSGEVRFRRPRLLVFEDTNPLLTLSNTEAVSTWNILAVIVPRIEVEVQIAGKMKPVSITIPDERIQLMESVLQNLPGTIRSWSGNEIKVNLDIIKTTEPITSLDELGSDPDGTVNYWIGPGSIYPRLTNEQLISYDSVIVASYFTLNSDGSEPYIPCNYFGLGMYDGNRGYAFVQMLNPSYDFWWIEEALPEEVFIHEWLHGVEGFYQSLGFHQVPGLHDAELYGYTDADPVLNKSSWRLWYEGYMQGSIQDSNGDAKGISPELWRLTPLGYKRLIKSPATN